MTNNDAIATVKPLTETEIAFLTARDRKIVRCTDGHDYVKMTCGRCGGSGSYSYCQRFGTECFGCMGPNGVGRGWVSVPVHKAIARIKRSEAADRRFAREQVARALQIEAECYANEANGFGYVTYAEVREATRAREQAEAEAAKKDALSAHVTAHATLIGRLLAASTRQGDFCASLAQEIISGRDPREFSPRCKSIVIDILAKAFGRRNSKAYNEAADELGDLLAA